MTSSRTQTRMRASAAILATGVLVLGGATAAAAAPPPAHPPAPSAPGWVLSTTDTGAGYAPTFVGNGYLGARVPAEGVGYSASPVQTQAELAGFFGKPDSFEKRASLPMWTALAFGDGTASYGGLPPRLSCAFDVICPGAYAELSGGADIESDHGGSTVPGFLAGLAHNSAPFVGATGTFPVTGAPAGPATVAVRYANGTGVPQTVSLGVDGALQQITLPPLANWDTWGVVDVPVTLRAGSNDLAITVTAADSAQVNIDFLAAFPVGATPPTAVAPKPTVGTTSGYRQSLDMRTGTITTSLDWTAPDGRTSSLTYTVAADESHAHLGTVTLSVVPHWTGVATVSDLLDGRSLDSATTGAPVVTGDTATLQEDVVSSGDLVTAALSSSLRVGTAVVRSTPVADLPTGTAGQQVSLAVKAGQSYRITKFVGVASSVDTDRSLTAATPEQAAAAASAEGARTGDAGVAARNASAWAALWQSDIAVPGDATTTAQVRAAMFYLLESTRPGVSWSASPGGLSSDGYNGHVFWDMETWMYPALLAQHPEFAVEANTYRQKLLPAAQQAAAQLSTPAHRIAGAKYPWESALSGVESTPPGNPEGTQEIHIDSDIALAQWQYYQASGDKTYLAKAWPVLQGIARYWASRVTPDANGGYHIDDVQGPDEYHAHVDDSATTNAGARTSLRIAVQAAGVLGVAPDPLWTTVADGLAIPYDATTGIHPEYAGYDGQTIKQADVTLLQYPFAVPMSRMVGQDDLDYYSTHTDLGGPSMTDAIASIVASQLGSPGCSSYTYLQRSSTPFLTQPFDQARETRTGGAFTFTTAEGGYLQEFLYGFTGLRWGTDSVSLDPSLPPQLPGVDLTGLHWQGRTFDVKVGPQQTTLTLHSGAALPVTTADGRTHRVQPHASLQVATRQPAATPTADLARCQTVTATNADASYPAVGAVDGTDATSWNATGPGASLTVDLGRVRAVHAVDVRTPGATTAYTIQVSTDGRTWDTVVVQGPVSQSATSHNIDPAASVRYLRYVAAPGATASVSALSVT
jgi:trehalose/maltose hydrolase-like predicted phosphorylase